MVAISCKLKMMNCYPSAFRAVFLKFSWLQVIWGISSVDSAAWHASINRHFPVVKRILTIAHFISNRTGLLK